MTLQIKDDPNNNLCSECGSKMLIAEEPNVYEVRFCSNEECKLNKFDTPTINYDDIPQDVIQPVELSLIDKIKQVIGL